MNLRVKISADAIEAIHMGQRYVTRLVGNKIRTFRVVDNVPGIHRMHQNGSVANRIRERMADKVPVEVSQTMRDLVHLVWSRHGVQSEMSGIFGGMM